MAVSNQTFYWVGSNQAMIAAGNSFPAGSTYGTGFSGPWGYNKYYATSFPYNATGDVYWGDRNNWFVKVAGGTGGSGGTSGYFDDDLGGSDEGWYWTTADRTPHRGDNVIFTSLSPNVERGLTFQAPLSPCLFGGRGNSGGNMWIGDISGDMGPNNVDAAGELGTLRIEGSYFNGGRSDGKIDIDTPGFPTGSDGVTNENNGFRVWGMRKLLDGVSADGHHWEGISIKSDAVFINGTYLTNPTPGDYDDYITPRHAVYIQDLENCNYVLIGMKEFYIYGGTCNNFYYNDYTNYGVDTFRAPNGNYFECGIGSSGLPGRPDAGRAEVTLSVLDTLRVTPLIFNSSVDWHDPGGQCDTLVWGPKRVTGDSNTGREAKFRYGSPTISKIDSYPCFGYGATSNATDIYNYWRNPLASPASFVPQPHTLNMNSGLELSGPSRFIEGSTGSDRIVVDLLKTYATNVNHPGVGTVPRTVYIGSWGGAVNIPWDIAGWNNSVGLASGAIISSLVHGGGNINVALAHPGGYTWDSPSESPEIRIDSLLRGPAGTIRGTYSEINPNHIVYSNYNHFSVGDPGSTAIEDALQVLDDGPRIKVAFGQIMKVGPVPYGSTAAFAESSKEKPYFSVSSGGGGGFVQIP